MFVLSLVHCKFAGALLPLTSVVVVAMFLHVSSGSLTVCKSESK